MTIIYLLKMGIWSTYCYLDFVLIKVLGFFTSMNEVHVLSQMQLSIHMEHTAILTFFFLDGKMETGKEIE